MPDNSRAGMGSRVAKLSPSFSAVHIAVYAVLAFAAYLPYMLMFAPGIVEIDTSFQLAEHMGYGDGHNGPGSYTSLFPLFTVWLFGSIFEAVSSVSTQSLGVQAICAVQCVGLAAGTSLLTCYLSRWKVNPLARFIAFVLLVGLPIFPLLAVDIGKDTVYCMFFVPFFVAYAEGVRKAVDGDVPSWKWVVLLVSCAVLSSLSTSKGAAVVCASLLVLGVFAIARKGKLVASCSLSAVFATVMFSMAMSSVVAPAYGVVNTTALRELLGTPVQQVITAMADGAVLQSWEREAIGSFVDYDKAMEHIESQITDSTKSYVYPDANTDKAIDFLRAYISVGSRYPGEYALAFFKLYSGYIESGTFNSAVLPRFMPNTTLEELGTAQSDGMDLPNDAEIMKEWIRDDKILYSHTLLPEYKKDHPYFGQWALNKSSEEARTSVLTWVVDAATVPVLGLPFQKSFYVLYMPLALIGLAAFAGTKRRKESYLIMVPLILCCLSAFAGPVAFARYIYPCLFLVPATAAIVISYVYRNSLLPRFSGSGKSPGYNET